MRPDHAAALSPSHLFRRAAEPEQKRPARTAKGPVPFSLRLSAEERAILEERAGDRPLGAYIRAQLLGGHAQARRRTRKPRADAKQIALLLAELGRARLSANLNQLAKAVNTGTLGVSAEVERELSEACRAVIAMRDALIGALGLKADG